MAQLQEKSRDKGRRGLQSRDRQDNAVCSGDIGLGRHRNSWPCSRTPRARLGAPHQEKTCLEQGAKAGLLLGSSYLVGLLHVVAVMNVVVNAVMTNMMMMDAVMTMMLCHRGRIGARRADDRRRESECNCKPEGREEGLLHGSFPSFAGGS
ncbi:hypothetical protein [Mesorhizobium sp. 113-3-3]|uniref:hypothetical protein n=1 Tax=Mesorhizobium sp. 113-3-3 TaxID=2744516 RepID=UPI001927AE7C|nr:hypothetical protein [Mesorhizobium sp. 113-3-3]